MEKMSGTCCATPDKSTSNRLPALVTRNRLMMAGGTVVIGGLVFNWGWLTAIGVAPILLAMAPCAVMCAVGFCAMGGAKKPATSD
jgi:fatty acid desaturase